MYLRWSWGRKPCRDAGHPRSSGACTADGSSCTSSYGWSRFRQPFSYLENNTTWTEKSTTMEKTWVTFPLNGVKNGNRQRVKSVIRAQNTIHVYFKWFIISYTTDRHHKRQQRENERCLSERKAYTCCSSVFCAAAFPAKIVFALGKEREVGRGKCSSNINY